MQQFVRLLGLSSLGIGFLGLSIQASAASFGSLKEASTAIMTGVNSPGFHTVTIGSQTFSTYFDAKGYMLVASGNTTLDGANYAAVANISARNNDQILNSTIASQLTTARVDEVRITATSTTFEAISRHNTVITDLQNFRTLTNTNNGATWTQTTTGTNHINATCGGTTGQGLASGFIYHACGNGSGLHWSPVTSQEKVMNSGGNSVDDLELWVRADPGPFINIRAARRAMGKGAPAGYYAFEMDGQNFTTYVDANGFVLVASGNTTLNGANYTPTSSITSRNGDQILTSAIAAKFTTSEVDEVRITATSTLFEALSSDDTVVTDLANYRTLTNTFNGAEWLQITTPLNNHINATCAGTSGQGLASGYIYHACGNGSGLHWSPVNSLEKVLFSGGNSVDDLELWVRAEENAVIPGQVGNQFTFESGKANLYILLILLGLVVRRKSLKTSQ